MSIPIPEDLRGEYEAAKWRVSDSGSPGSSHKMKLIERIAALEQERDQLRAELERRSAPVSDYEWGVSSNLSKEQRERDQWFRKAFDDIIAARRNAK